MSQNHNSSQNNDQQLLERLLAGDESAWHSIISEYSGFLISLVQRTHSNYGVEISFHDAEDIVSEVWKNLIENDMRIIRICLERKNFFPTLSVLAKNRSIDRMRKRKIALVELNEEYHTSYGREPFKDAFSNISSANILEAINKLPYKQKILVNLFFLQGKRYRDISRLTGIPQNSIGPTLARAIQQLRKNLSHLFQ